MTQEERQKFQPTQVGEGVVVYINWEGRGYGATSMLKDLAVTLREEFKCR